MDECKLVKLYSVLSLLSFAKCVHFGMACYEISYFDVKTRSSWVALIDCVIKYNFSQDFSNEFSLRRSGLMVRGPDFHLANKVYCLIWSGKLQSFWATVEDQGGRTLQLSNWCFLLLWKMINVFSSSFSNCSLPRSPTKILQKPKINLYQRNNNFVVWTSTSPFFCLSWKLLITEYEVAVERRCFSMFFGKDNIASSCHSSLIFNNNKCVTLWLDKFKKKLITILMKINAQKPSQGGSLQY